MPETIALYIIVQGADTREGRPNNDVLLFGEVIVSPSGYHVKWEALVPWSSSRKQIKQLILQAAMDKANTSIADVDITDHTIKILFNAPEEL